MKRILGVGFIISLLLIVTGCTTDELNDLSNKMDNMNKKDNFSHTVEKSYADKYGFSYYLEGIVTNNSDKEYSYAQIEFICYDKDGNNIGTAMANTNNLLGNQTWKYKAMLMTNDVNVDHCDFKEVSGW